MSLTTVPETAVQASEMRYRRLFEAAQDGILILDADTGQIDDVNPFLTNLLGYSREQLLGNRLWEIGPFKDISATKAEFRELQHQTYVRYEDLPLETSDGQAINVEFVSNVYLVDGRKVIQCNIRDITERKRAELALARERQELQETVQQLERSRNMLQLIIESIPVRVFWKDRNLRFLGCNSLFARDAGFDHPQELLGKDDLATGWRDSAELYRREDRQVMESRCPKINIVEPQTTPAGTTIWLNTSKVPLQKPDGEVFGVLGLYEDITERKRTQESNTRLAMAVEQAAEAIVIADATGTMLYVNPAFEKITGYPRQEATGQNPRILQSGKHDADFYQRLWAVLTRGEVWKGRFINKRKDGLLYEEEATISPIRDLEGKTISYVAVKRDITEQLKNERLTRRSQRLEAIGTLASGVAHDLNNALAPIVMGVELVKMKYPGESQIVDLFQNSAKRATDMVRQLLSFAKGAEGERVSIQPAHLLKDMQGMIKGSFPKNINLVVKRDPMLPTVLGDPTQLHQVLLNLCVNARDAMPLGGTLTLEAQRVAVDAAYASGIPDAKPGDYVALRVCDTGTGIPPEILHRIFDPFFTSKDPDKGTGLGLSTVVGIVKGHGGFMQVYSHPGQGSTFTAYLPADAAGSDTELAIKPAVEFRGQGETILLVDDEPAVREIARAVLRRLNFEPLTATDAADGLIQATEHRTTLRAVVTDLHMPHMDGLEFVRSLRRMLPDIPVVVASGHMEDPLVEEFKALGVTSRLDKPFNEAQLAEALKNLLAPK